AQAVARMPRVPHTLGDWQARDLEPDDRAFEQAGARGYWMRSYIHGRDRHAVLVVLMCGRAGRMAVHTPDICYQGAGYDMYDTPAQRAIRDDLGENLGTFWTARFAKPGGVGTDLRLYWAWKGQGDWQAPANPRWEFRGEP